MTDAKQIADAVKAYGKLFAGRYLIREDDASALLALVNGRDYTTLRQAATLLGSSIAVIGGTGELDIPAFLRKSPRDMNAPPYNMSEDETRARLANPENFSTYEIVISPEGVYKREIWHDKDRAYESGVTLDGNMKVEPLSISPLEH